MFRSATLGLSVLAIAALFRQTASAGDLLSIVFEDSSVMVNGQKVNCDLHYVLISDSGIMHRGTLLQFAQFPEDREHYSLSKGRFSKSDNDLIVQWTDSNDQNHGGIQRAKIRNVDRSTGRFDYCIYQHDDQSQVGQSMVCRAVHFSQLPNYVKDAVRQHLLRLKLSAELERGPDWLVKVDERILELFE